MGTCFNSRIPIGMRLLPPPQSCRRACFNSRTPGGVRPCGGDYNSIASRFQFTHPGRGATTIFNTSTITLQSFNSRTPGGVRPNLDRLKQMTPIVSIHAPREGCDCWRSRAADALYVVSIHAPREGCDLSLLLEGELTSGFQFTHPGRGATVA